MDVVMIKVSLQLSHLEGIRRHITIMKENVKDARIPLEPIHYQNGCQFSENTSLSAEIWMQLRNPSQVVFLALSSEDTKRKTSREDTFIGHKEIT